MTRLTTLTSQPTPALIEQLAVSPSFGCLTRPAFELSLACVDSSDMAVIYFDIDWMKQANDRYTKEGVNDRIRAAIAFRRDDIGQWFSGDEFVAFLSLEDALGFAQRVQAQLHEQGLSATILIQTSSRDIDQAERTLSACKARGRNRIYVN